MRLRLSLLVVLLSGIGVGVDCQNAFAEETPAPKFEADIVPILEARCLKCHGDGKLEAGLDLRRRFLILKGGDSGAGFVAEKPDESLLIQKIMADEMPPKDEGRLDDKQKGLLKRWIATGAKTVAEKEKPIDEAEQASRLSEEDRAYWAFQPPRWCQLLGRLSPESGLVQGSRSSRSIMLKAYSLTHFRVHAEYKIVQKVVVVT